MQTRRYGHGGRIAEEYATLSQLRTTHFQNRWMRPDVVYRMQDRIQLVEGNRRERGCPQSALLSVDAAKRRSAAQSE